MSSNYSRRSPELKKRMAESVTRFRRNRKLTLLNHAGGMKCTKCGYDKPVLDVYEFHHVDPSQKDPLWGKMIANNHSIDKMKKEIEKCVVLCANCHRETHWEENRIQMRERETVYSLVS